MEKATLVYHIYSGEISYILLNSDGECILQNSFERCNGLLDEGQDIDNFFIEDHEVGDYLNEIDWEILVDYPIELIGIYCI